MKGGLIVKMHSNLSMNRNVNIDDNDRFFSYNITMSTNRNKTAGAVLLLLGIVIALRVFNYATVMHEPYIQYRTGDESFYHNWALAVSHGQFSRGAAFFTSPLFAYVLGVFYSTAGDGINLVIAMNSVLGIAAVLLIYLTARRTAGQAAAVVSLILAGFCVAPVYYESFTEKTALVLFLTSLTFYLITVSAESGKPGHWTAAGASAGLGALAHPLLLVFLPITWISMALLSERANKVTLKGLLLFSAMTFIVILPATIHNYSESKDFVLICSNAGQNFYVGNHAGNRTGLYTSPAFSYASLGSEEYNFKKEAERRTGRSLRPSEVSSYWFRQGVAEALADPGLSFARLARKLRWTVGNEEITDTRNINFYRGKIPVFNLPLWGFGLVSFLGMAGMVFLVREKKALFSILFTLLYTAGISLFFVYGRYRLPLLVPFSILAGAGVIQTCRLVAAKRTRALLIALPFACFAFWLSFSKVLSGTSESFFIDYYNMGSKYLNEGRYDAAAAEYEKALWERPGDHPATETVILGLADLYMSHGNPAAAEQLLRRAITAYPGNSDYSGKLMSLKKIFPSP